MMGEFLDPVVNEFPLWLVSSILCSAAIGLCAILQPGEERDDDDSGSGCGGLMQPIVVGAR